MTSMGGRYRKGSDFERAVVAAFADRGWVAFRAAGSGKLERSLPDVVALKGGRVLIVECKATSKDRISLRPAMMMLSEFSAKAGADAFLAVRFFRQRPRFYDIRSLLKRETYTINDKDEYLTVDSVTGEQGRLGDVL